MTSEASLRETVDQWVERLLESSLTAESLLPLHFYK